MEDMTINTAIPIINVAHISYVRKTSRIGPNKPQIKSLVRIRRHQEHYTSPKCIYSIPTRQHAIWKNTHVNWQFSVIQPTCLLKVLIKITCDIQR